jgi:hypothetical protein
MRLRFSAPGVGICLYRALIASQMEATSWYILPSLPMFLLVPHRCAAGTRSGQPRNWLPGEFLLYFAMTRLLAHLASSSELSPLTAKTLCYFLHDFIQILYSVEQAGPA